MKFESMESSEADVQKSLIELFEVMGFEVLTTSRVVKRCSHCHRFSTRSDGVSKGLPDLIVHNRYWKVPAWVGIEVKGPKTKVSPEQQDLADRGLTFICRSLDDGLAVIEHLKTVF